MAVQKNRTLRIRCRSDCGCSLYHNFLIIHCSWTFHEFRHVRLIFKCAFAPGAVFGGAPGSAVIWGLKRARFLIWNRYVHRTQHAAQVLLSFSPTCKAGRSRAFSSIHRYFICLYSNRDHHDPYQPPLLRCAAGNADQSARIREQHNSGAPWVQAAINLYSPGDHLASISIALLFFATLQLVCRQMYNCESTLTYFFKGSQVGTVIALVSFSLAFVVLAGVMKSTTAWNF